MQTNKETQIYLDNKREIFIKLVDSIEQANQLEKKSVYVKNLKILDEFINVIIKKEEWLDVLEKAISFFESFEDYEMCQHCKIIKDSIIKKNLINDKDSTT